jgi:hypothetical protein
MVRICILIRVYDRTEDLKYCLEIIKKTWLSFDYFILVVSNGGINGFEINTELKDQIDLLIELDSNAGHLKGNAQLLQEGLPKIPDDTSHTIILEADTWVHGDKLVEKYVNVLNNSGEVWAGAHWYTHLYSLATDFSIIGTKFLKSNPGVFSYTGFPERHAANYLLDNGHRFRYIKENMPIHLPSYIKKFPFATGIRFNVFPKSKMVTHHIELLKGGMDRKKKLFNTLARTSFFKGESLSPSLFLRLRIILSIGVSYFFPKRGWFEIKQIEVIEKRVKV